MLITDKLLFHKHLEVGEAVLYAVHKHCIEIFIPSLQLVFLGFVLPWAAYLLLFSTKWFLMVAIGWSVFASIRFLYIALWWYGDVILVTNQSMIQVQWGGPFSNAATRIPYEGMEGVGYDINGFWQTVMGYGQLTLKVNSGNNLVMFPVKNPKKVEVQIANCQKDYLAHKGLQDSNKLKELMTEMVGHYLRGN